MASRAPRASDASNEVHLCEEELRLIELVVAGLKDREIASRLRVGEAEVRAQLASILRQLGVADRLELVIFAYLHALVEPPTKRPKA